MPIGVKPKLISKNEQASTELIKRGLRRLSGDCNSYARLVL